MLPMPKGECERGWFVIGMGEMAACDGWAECERDMERSEVGVLSSTADEEGCCWWACRVDI